MGSKMANIVALLSLRSSRDGQAQPQNLRAVAPAQPTVGTSQHYVAATKTNTYNKKRASRRVPDDAVERLELKRLPLLGELEGSDHHAHLHHAEKVEKKCSRDIVFVVP